MHRVSSQISGSCDHWQLSSNTVPSDSLAPCFQSRSTKGCGRSGILRLRGSPSGRLSQANPGVGPQSSDKQYPSRRPVALRAVFAQPLGVTRIDWTSARFLHLTGRFRGPIGRPVSERARSRVSGAPGMCRQRCEFWRLVVSARPGWFLDVSHGSTSFGASDW